MGRIYQVVVLVTGLDGQKITIDLCDNEKDMQRITVLELKQKIVGRIPGIPAGRTISDMKLIFGNKRLEADDTRLCEYGVIHKSSIHMVISLDGGPSL
uniref:Ubiquitin-like domain-containing protein n=1 Tax=Poecilia reticulata TaxID=8081 RepID=A0A3P9NCL7_POERE